MAPDAADATCFFAAEKRLLETRNHATMVFLAPLLLFLAWVVAQRLPKRLETSWQPREIAEELAVYSS